MKVSWAKHIHSKAQAAFCACVAPNGGFPVCDRTIDGSDPVTMPAAIAIPPNSIGMSCASVAHAIWYASAAALSFPSSSPASSPT